MKNYALISLNPATFVRFMDGPANCKQGFAVVPYSREDAPEYNALTHKLESKRTVTSDSVVDGFEAVPLSESEAKIATFNAAVAAGYDTGMGFSLKLHDYDRNQFNQQLALVNEAIAVGVITLETEIAIWDTEGEKHLVTAGTFKQLIIGLGFHFMQLNAAKE
jgi:hypothetical protein